MTVRYLVIAAAVILCAGTLLYIADYRSLVPATPQELFAVK